MCTPLSFTWHCHAWQPVGSVSCYGASGAATQWWGHVGAGPKVHSAPEVLRELLPFFLALQRQALAQRHSATTPKRRLLATHWLSLWIQWACGAMRKEKLCFARGHRIDWAWDSCSTPMERLTLANLLQCFHVGPVCSRFAQNTH